MLVIFIVDKHGLSKISKYNVCITEFRKYGDANLTELQICIAIFPKLLLTSAFVI